MRGRILDSYLPNGDKMQKKTTTLIYGTGNAGKLDLMRHYLEHAAGDSPARFKGFAILLGRDRRMWEGLAGECAAESPRILPNLRAAGFFTG